MSNYSNFDLRKFLAEGKKADKKSMEEQEEVALSEELTEGTDIIDMVMQNPDLLGYLAAYGGGLFAAVKGGLSAHDYCEANPDNKLCKAWKDFSSDFSSAKKQARDKGRGYEEGVEENLNEEPVSIAAVAAGVAAIFGGSAGLVKLIDKAEAGDFGPKGKKLAQHLTDMGAAAGKAIHGDGDHQPFEEGVEEELNEEPVSIAAVAAGLVAVFGGSIGLTKLMDKAEAGDFGPQGEKIAKHLRDMGKGAADAIHHRGYEEGVEEGEVEESVIAGIAALVGSSLAAAKVLDWIQANYPEATEKFVKAADAGMRGSGKSGMMEAEKKKDKVDEAKFKKEIKSILES